MKNDQPLDYRLRAATKRTDLPEDVIRLLADAYYEICLLYKERDAARRNVCFQEAAVLSFGPNGVPYHPSVAHKIAKDYGWDCFKENDDAQESN